MKESELFGCVSIPRADVTDVARAATCFPFLEPRTIIQPQFTFIIGDMWRGVARRSLTNQHSDLENETFRRSGSRAVSKPRDSTIMDIIMMILLGAVVLDDDPWRQRSGTRHGSTHPFIPGFLCSILILVHPRPLGSHVPGLLISATSRTFGWREGGRSSQTPGTLRPRLCHRRAPLS